MWKFRLAYHDKKKLSELNFLGQEKTRIYVVTDVIGNMGSPPEFSEKKTRGDS